MIAPSTRSPVRMGTAEQELGSSERTKRAILLRGEKFLQRRRSFRSQQISALPVSQNALRAVPAPRHCRGNSAASARSFGCCAQVAVRDRDCRSSVSLFRREDDAEIGQLAARPGWPGSGKFPVIQASSRARCWHRRGTRAVPAVASASARAACSRMYFARSSACRFTCSVFL